MEGEPGCEQIVIVLQTESYNSETVCYSISTPADWKNHLWLALLVIAAIFCAIEVAFGIKLVVMVSNPPNGSKQINTIFLPLPYDQNTMGLQGNQRVCLCVHNVHGHI